MASTTSTARDVLVPLFMPQRCYDEIFDNLHLSVACFLVVLGKVAGLWIIVDTLVAPLPQLLKILWRGSVHGLSLPSVLLHLYALSCPVVYAVANQYPYFAWAERLFSLAQIAVIAFLILCYRGNILKGLLFLLSYYGLMICLGSHVPLAVVRWIEWSSFPSLIASKVLQAGTNYCNGHTGQLSTVSVFLMCAGSVSVFFNSHQDTGFSTETLSHSLTASLSCIILFQVLCYRSVITDQKKKKKSE